MFTLVTLFLLMITFQTSLQDCSSTVAITTCSWTSPKSTKPLEISDYKPYLSISPGSMDFIPSGYFRNLPEVTILQLSENRITKLEANSLEGLVNLKKLNLFKNRLSIIDQNSFKHSKELEVLDLGQNELVSIHEKTFEPLVNLKELNLAFNKLREVPTALNPLTNLRVLRLDYNKIESLKPNGFLKLTNLETLQLNDNKLMIIAQKSFKGLSKLRTLDLSSNYLTDLTVADVVRDARNLKVIKLNLNGFFCKPLEIIVEDFKEKGVEVARGSSSTFSVNGISCKNA